MMLRRSFLAALATVPGFGWLRPQPKISATQDAVIVMTEIGGSIRMGDAYLKVGIATPDGLYATKYDVYSFDGKLHCSAIAYDSDGQRDVTMKVYPNGPPEGVGCNMVSEEMAAFIKPELPRRRRA